LARARDFEDTLDRSRRFANDHKFKVGMQILKGTLDCDAAGAALTDLADVVLAALFDRVRAEMESRHGRIGAGPGTDRRRAMCVVALGKLGGREITENSDLDLLFLYDDPVAGTDADAGARSDGPRPLAASQYFARLSQQLITAVSAPTAEGKLYDVDMRLRPSGNAGPIATSLAAFERYQAASAWTWEHMALTRARVVAGPDDLGAHAAAAIRTALTVPRDADKLRAAVLDMRARLARGHPPASLWDVKYADGGLIDVEFIAQYLQLLHAHRKPEVLDTNTGTALARLEETGAVTPEDAKCLIRAGRLWRTIQGMLRFTYEGVFNEEAAPAGLRLALARAAETPDFEALKAEMNDTARRVRAIFTRLIGDPGTTAAG
jgi:glutamate-ammonia-ligase adenylyltransferase